MKIISLLADKAMRLALAFSLLTAGGELAAPPMRAEAILDENVRVTHFEQMNYSLFAYLAAPTGGVVVIHVSLSKSGTVTSATPLSGRKGLLDECVKNALKWEFDASKATEAIIVYVFEVKGLCQTCSGSSTFYPPNLLLVTTGQRVVNP